MKRNPRSRQPKEGPPMLPEEVVQAMRGGRQPEAAYAEAVVAGRSPDLKKVVGFDKQGNLIYAHSLADGLKNLSPA